MSHPPPDASQRPDLGRRPQNFTEALIHEGDPEATPRGSNMVSFPARKPRTHPSIISTGVIADYRCGIRRRSFLWARFYGTRVLS